MSGASNAAANSAAATEGGATNLAGTTDGTAKTDPHDPLQAEKYALRRVERALGALASAYGACVEKGREDPGCISYADVRSAIDEDADIAEVVPFMPNLLPVFTNAVARPSTASAPQYNEVSTVFFANVADVLSGAQSGDDAVVNIALDLEDLLGFEVE